LTASQQQYFMQETPGQRLYDGKGRMMRKVASRNSILIANACSNRTLQNAQKPQFGSGQLFINPKTKPRPNITPQQLQNDLHNIRGAILMLNQSLRFESRQTVHVEVEEMYLTAMRLFFKREMEERSFAGNARHGDPSLLNALAGLFSDISHHANRYVPTAVPIAAESFVRAMHRLREIGWFRGQGKNG
jgi:hypothetical protein